MHDLHETETFEKLAENKVKCKKRLNCSLAAFEMAFQDFQEAMIHTLVLRALEF